jgi:hypothetical protein
MVTSASRQTVAADRSTWPIVWAWLWDEDRNGAPVAKVYFRYYDDREQPQYLKLAAGHDDGEVWIQPVGRRAITPSDSDMQALRAELEADYTEQPTQYKVERASEVNL